MKPILREATASDAILRPFRTEDTDAIAGVYRDAVRTIGPQAYSAEQVEGAESASHER